MNRTRLSALTESNLLAGHVALKLGLHERIVVHGGWDSQGESAVRLNSSRPLRTHARAHPQRASTCTHLCRTRCGASSDQPNAILKEQRDRHGDAFILDCVDWTWEVVSVGMVDTTVSS